MKTRMNLFRQILEGKKPGVAPAGAKAAWTFKLPNFKAGKIPAFGLAAGAIFALSAALVTSAYLSRGAQLTEMLAKVAEAEAELNRLTTAASVTGAERVPAQDEGPGGLDGTWASLMWKIAVSTGPGIIFVRVEMGDPAAPPSQPGDKKAQRRIAVEGQARSVGALREWVESLVQGIPSYRFVMESQASDGEAPFPVRFRVAAKNL